MRYLLFIFRSVFSGDAKLQDRERIERSLVLATEAAQSALIRLLTDDEIVVAVVNERDDDQGHKDMSVLGFLLSEPSLCCRYLPFFIGERRETRHPWRRCRWIGTQLPEL